MLVSICHSKNSGPHGQVDCRSLLWTTSERSSGCESRGIRQRTYTRDRRRSFVERDVSDCSSASEMMSHLVDQQQTFVITV
ncbi:hypothetical protein FKM82_011237 [Ascaphus truei]